MTIVRVILAASWIETLPADDFGDESEVNCSYASWENVRGPGISQVTTLNLKLVSFL